MPRKARDNYKTWLANAIQYNRYSLRCIKRLIHVFAPDHPDYAELLYMVLMLKRQEQRGLVDVWRHAWGADFSKWRKYVSVKDTRKRLRG